MKCKPFEVVIPVLNEEASLEPCLMKLLAFMRMEFQDGPQYLVTIADNGSTDQTPDIAKRLMQNCQELRFLRVREIGVGKALKKAWGQSRMPIFGYMDLDLATDLKHLPHAISLLSDDAADIAVGSRLIPGSVVENRTLKREISSRAFNVILQHYLQVRFSDGMCGFKFLKKSIYDQLQPAMLNDGWFFATELLVRAEWAGFKIHEIPVQWTDGRNSKARIFSLAKKYLLAMRELKREKCKSPSKGLGYET